MTRSSKEELKASAKWMKARREREAREIGGPGCLAMQKARSTGTRVALYDAELADLDPSGGKWVTSCEDHGTVCNHETKRLAQASLPYPFNWCEKCAEIIAGKRPRPVNE